MCEPIFITGIGTGVGKTLVAAIAAEALEADYWKPIQAGFDEGTDSEWVQAHISNTKSSIHPEVYKLKKPASPHVAAREEGLTISVEKIIGFSFIIFSPLRNDSIPQKLFDFRPIRRPQ